MNTPLDDEYFEGLREEGLLLVDYESRKVGVAINEFGEVLLICQQGDESQVLSLDPSEIDSLCASLQLHKRKAAAFMDKLMAEYETFTAIQRASGI